MPEKTKAKPEPVDLEAAIDALLAEIDATCTRFENPEVPQEDQDLAEYTRAVTAVKAAPNTAGLATVAANPDVDDPATDAEDAIDAAGETAEMLLAQAADDLIGVLEAEVDGATPEDAAEPESDVQVDGASDEAVGEREASVDDASVDEANDALLTEALDALIAETTSPKVPAAAEAVATAGSEPEATREPEPEPAPDLESVSTEIDDLLDGSFESTDGEAVDTEGLDTTPDPALMLDEGEDASSVTAGVNAPEPATPKPATPAPVATTKAASTKAATKPAKAVIETASPASETPAPEPIGPEPGATAPVPAVAARPKPATRPARSGPKAKALDLLTAVRVWITPRLRSWMGSAAAMAKPLGARGLMLMSKPLEGRPPAVRDSIGWVAIWTLFLGLCVWASLVLRSPDAPPAVTAGTRVMTAADAD